MTLNYACVDDLFYLCVLWTFYILVGLGIRDGICVCFTCLS